MEAVLTRPEKSSASVTLAMPEMSAKDVMMAIRTRMGIALARKTARHRVSIVVPTVIALTTAEKLFVYATRDIAAVSVMNVPPVIMRKPRFAFWIQPARKAPVPFGEVVKMVPVKSCVPATRAMPELTATNVPPAIMRMPARMPAPRIHAILTLVLENTKSVKQTEIALVKTATRTMTRT